MIVQIKRILSKNSILASIGRRLYKRSKVVEWSPYKNIYYCCTQKTASQWFKAVFDDFAVYKYTGLEVFHFNQYLDQLQEACTDGSTPRWEFASRLYSGHAANIPLPKRTIGTHFYISYTSYLTIPKPKRYRTFFIQRDPRDIVVSWYFSVKNSHSPIGLVPKFRDELNGLSLSDGLKYSIDKLEERGIFHVQRSWMDISEDYENIKIFRYEDFAPDNYSFLKNLFDYLEIVMPEREFDALYDRHRFEEYSGDRKRGVENMKSHYRKGKPGDWINYFDSSIMAYFRQVTEDFLEILGYPE